ncbi:hypothetical protein DSO57_1017413 [Entomophthora muscae]|uniref:Uncharacterized protein n=1 Tax=Entomophthora muscae TaxID=34485 RepID=A0ACC2TFM6_9FUNG|nr:hypothetical protein DSO57_1017413 [Entomophthora muscae]
MASLGEQFPEIEKAIKDAAVTFKAMTLSEINSSRCGNSLPVSGIYLDANKINASQDAIKVNPDLLHHSFENYCDIGEGMQVGDQCVPSIDI